jgi:DUF971 family protein
MTPRPTRLSRLENNRLLIEWDDGQKREYTARELRDRCPCATCREKRSADKGAPAAKAPGAKAPLGMLPVLSAAETRPLAIAGMRPVGNYAYCIDFSDGHGTGIYGMELLRELGQGVADPS